MPALFRSLSPLALLVVGGLAFAATGCSSSVDEADTDEGELRPGEVEEKVFEEHFASKET